MNTARQLELPPCGYRQQITLGGHTHTPAVQGEETPLIVLVR